MGTSKEWDLFEEKSIKPRFKQTMQELENVYQNLRKVFKCQFLVDFKNLCRQRLQMHPDFSYRCLTFEFLHTNLMAHNYKYHIMAYGKDWYLNPGIKVGELDTTVIFNWYHKLEDQLKNDAKRYVGKITLLEVEEHMRYLLPCFQEYVKELVQYAIIDAVDFDEFHSLIKEDEFQIRVSECLEPGYLVYREQRHRNEKEMKQKLQENERETYCYEDFRGMDFVGLHLPVHDLRYTNFSDGCLEEANLSLSLMIGSRFLRCRMRGVRLTGCILHESNFTKADLRGAKLDYTLICDGKDSANGWRITGYAEGRFSGADLREANLRGCLFCGVDFCDADVRGASFEEARLYRCRFTKEQMEQITLTKEQRKQIVIV